MARPKLKMPEARDLGWALKPNDSAHFHIQQRPNGQFGVVLNHALLRGTHYHYEVVIGASADNPIARLLNARLSAKFGPEFFAAWQSHNVIEVGTFENHLPVLFAQKDTLPDLSFSRTQDPAPQGRQHGFDRSLFDTRVAGFAAASDAFAYQAFDKPSFL